MGMLRLSFPLWNSPLLSSTLSRPFVIIQFIDRLLILILFSQCCISSPSLPHAGLQAALILRIWVVFLSVFGKGGRGFISCSVRCWSHLLVYPGGRKGNLPLASQGCGITEGAAGTVIPQSEGVLDAPSALLQTPAPPLYTNIPQPQRV